MIWTVELRGPGPRLWRQALWKRESPGPLTSWAVGSCSSRSWWEQPLRVPASGLGSRARLVASVRTEGRFAGDPLLLGEVGSALWTAHHTPQQGSWDCVAPRLGRACFTRFTCRGPPQACWVQVLPHSCTERVTSPCLLLPTRLNASPLGASSDLEAGELGACFLFVPTGPRELCGRRSVFLSQPTPRSVGEVARPPPAMRPVHCVGLLGQMRWQVRNCDSAGHTSLRTGVVCSGEPPRASARIIFLFAIVFPVRLLQVGRAKRLHLAKRNFHTTCKSTGKSQNPEFSSWGAFWKSTLLIFHVRGCRPDCGFPVTPSDSFPRANCVRVHAATRESNGSFQGCSVLGIGGTHSNPLQKGLPAGDNSILCPDSLPVPPPSR